MYPSYSFLSNVNTKVKTQFKNLIPDKLDDEIIRYLLDPNSSHSFDDLPLRASAYPLDSKIIHAKDVALITNWINRNQGRPYHIKDLNYEFKLIYRVSREGFGINNFHTNCGCH